MTKIEKLASLDYLLRTGRANFVVGRLVLRKQIDAKKPTTTAGVQPPHACGPQNGATYPPIYFINFCQLIQSPGLHLNLL